MVSRLTKAMGALSQNDEEPQERRKSARLNKSEQHQHQHHTPDVTIHDSGTESDEEELLTITSGQNERPNPLRGFRNYDEYTFNPPRVSASPAWKRDRDETESWDSFGRESGIMTGDNDSDNDGGVATPTPARRRLRGEDDSSPSPGKRGHEDSNPMADHPIAWRLRSFNFTNNAEREVKIPVRRCPVHVLINRPPVPSAYRFDRVDAEVESAELMPAPAPKRGRRNSHRPSLDFEKMVQTRIEEPTTSTLGPVTRSQITPQ